MTVPAARASALGWAVLSATALWAALRPFGFADPRFIYADDFFYYLVPAQHFLEHGQFSLFPGMATNGFHPLWMGVIVALLAVCGGVAGGGFYLALNLLSAALVLVAGRAAARLAACNGAAPGTALAAGAMVVAVQLMIGLQGMEVTLAVPLMLHLVEYFAARANQPLTRRQWLWAGLLASLSVLARLDIALLLAPWGCVQLWQRRGEWRRWPLTLAGAAPLALYLLVNHRVMGIWLPVSGAAKQLKPDIAFSIEPLLWLVTKHGPGMVLMAVLCAMLVFSASVVLGAAERTRVRASLRALLAGLPLYYGVLASLSDWQLWPWYFYPAGLVPPVALAAMQPFLGRLGARSLGALALLAVLMQGALASAYTRPEYSGILRETEAIAPFVAAHPGIYAMGDRAGTAGALLPVKLLQLEGLMNDAAFLQHIRGQKPLGCVLAQYGVDYYITTEPLPMGECWRFREPVRGGPRSPAMAGESCAKPVFYSDAWPRIWIFRSADVR